MDITEFEHIQTGAKIIFLENEDKHYSYAITYLTPANDDRGIGHLVEHLVLRSSEKYGKDIYYKLLDDESYSYVGATTYCDKTVYSASTSEQEKLYSIIKFYNEATLFANFSDTASLRDIFKEECYAEMNGALIAGRAYNEMLIKEKDKNYILDTIIYKKIMNGTVYSNIPGGKSNKLTTVTLQDCIDYYQKYYSPTNCYVVIYGKVNKEECLDILGEYFKHFNKVSIPQFNKKEIIQTWRNTHVHYNISTVKESIFSINWIIPLGNRPDSILHFYIIKELFKNNKNMYSNCFSYLDSDSLKKLFFIFDHSTYYPTFEVRLIIDYIVLQDIETFKKDVMKMIQTLFQKITNSEIQVAIKSFLKKYNCQFKSVHYSKGLLYTLDLLSSWINYEQTHENFDAFIQLNEVSIDEIRNLIDKYLLNNKNLTIVLN